MNEPTRILSSLLLAFVGLQGCERNATTSSGSREGDSRADFGDTNRPGDTALIGDAIEPGEASSFGDSADPGDSGPPPLGCDNSSAILADCSRCPSRGRSVEQMRCAIELRDNRVYLQGELSSPVRAATKGSFEAIARLGSPRNDLAPLMGSSYAILATGTVTDLAHNVDLGGGSLVDPFVAGDVPMHDIQEWRLRLKAPAGAGGVQVHYLVLSAEYDENVGSNTSDKFRIYIEAASTAAGARRVINFAPCRHDAGPSDFVCEDAELHCEPGESYCHVSANSALSECCWRGDCPAGSPATDLAGTGFECAADVAQDDSTRGSSTGWLATEWPVEAGEELNLIFHIHDAGNHLEDSAVIIDKVLFVGTPRPGTRACD